MATKGFIRVSTLDQDTEKNKLDILQFANDKKLGHRYSSLSTGTKVPSSQENVIYGASGFATITFSTDG